MGDEISRRKQERETNIFTSQSKALSAIILKSGSVSLFPAEESKNWTISVK